MRNLNTSPQKSNEPIDNTDGDNQNAAAAPVTVYVEPLAAFASGLPAWNIEPPAVVVRRKARI